MWEDSLQPAHGQLMKASEVELLSASEVFGKRDVYFASGVKPLKI